MTLSVSSPSTGEWIKKMRTIEYYSAIKKEWNNAICSNMDGPRYCDPKWSKLAKYHDTTYMWTLKYDTNELTKQTYRHSKQTYGYQREKMGGG